MLHYSCQALHVGLAAAGPADRMNLASKWGVVYTRLVPPATLSVANTSRAGSLLKSVHFTASAMLALVSDVRAPVPLFNAPDLSGMGYLLGASAASATFSSLASLQGEGGSGFFPRVNGVVVAVQLTQAGLYTVTTVQRVVSFMLLLSQVASLLGLVRVFGALFAAARRLLAKCAPAGAAADTDALAPLRDKLLGELMELRAEVASQKKELADVRAIASAQPAPPAEGAAGQEAGARGPTPPRTPLRPREAASTPAVSNAAKYGFWFGSAATAAGAVAWERPARHSPPASTAVLAGDTAPAALLDSGTRHELQLRAPPRGGREVVNPLFHWRGTSI